MNHLGSLPDGVQDLLQIAGQLARATKFLNSIM
jgi:hypothetical protein